ncbi:hypothetical protein AWB67_05712 [Caballeronia terrestris]|uniref:Uncharacterized protein n=1 Tax=Caballeronia terrestris TaxID=1226301 RepID=A0A158KJH5_9BURK|nr:hypothetical protein AWB67_05712 [Caballeronia terrestris]
MTMVHAGVVFSRLSGPQNKASALRTQVSTLALDQARHLSARLREKQKGGDKKCI